MCCTDSTCLIEIVQGETITCDKKIRGALGTLEILGQAPLLLHATFAHTNSPTRGVY
jgi:hypothetical protein